MLNTLKTAILLAGSLGVAAVPAHALQTTVTQVDKNADGTMTYHFSVKLDGSETLSPAEGKSPADFVTIYNFFGLVDGSAKSPAGWSFTSEEFGRTPTLNGYPLVLPVDVPNTPNLTWTVTKPVAAGAQVDGFTAITRVPTTVEGEYSAQITRQAPAPKLPAGTSALPAAPTKQALIGLLPTPSFLADAK